MLFQTISAQVDQSNKRPYRHNSRRRQACVPGTRICQCIQHGREEHLQFQRYLRIYTFLKVGDLLVFLRALVERLVNQVFAELLHDYRTVDQGTRSQGRMSSYVGVLGGRAWRTARSLGRC